MIRRLSITAVAVASLAGCGRETPAIDEALRQDLSLASQAYMPQQYLSPIEAGYAQGYGQPGYAASPPGAYQQAVARQPRIYRAPSSGGSTAGRASGPRVVKHTKRDAAIGAVAGAAIGAVTSGKRDRLKGAVIGAAAGAILGGVIGNNVDLSRIPR